METTLTYAVNSYVTALEEKIIELMKMPQLVGVKNSF